ncbi:MAG: SPOR domain-containing protein [Bacteroidales bacterium]|nr:SPOR domain-containing protein [Bacteroidales bacterium]
MFFLLAAGNPLTAQDHHLQIYAEIEKNRQIELHHPKQLEQLLLMQIANNRLQKGVQGYRIRIFSQSGQSARGKAYAMKDDFLNNFPDQHAYEQYNEPNFQIFVGDFRTKTEALYLLKRIARKYPSAFIVNSSINVN